MVILVKLGVGTMVLVYFGIFMFIGYIQFQFASQEMFGDLGKEPKGINDDKVEIEEISTTNVERDRLIVVGVLAFFSIFFWAAFEQAGASMNIFARDLYRSFSRR